MTRPSDQASALVAMNDQLRRMTVQLEHMAVSSAKVTKSFEQLSDLGQKVVHSHFLLDALVRNSGGGGGGGTAFGGYARQQVFQPGRGGQGGRGGDGSQGPPGPPGKDAPGDPFFSRYVQTSRPGLGRDYLGRPIHGPGPPADLKGFGPWEGSGFLTGSTAPRLSPGRQWAVDRETPDPGFLAGGLMAPILKQRRALFQVGEEREQIKTGTRKVSKGFRDIVPPDEELFENEQEWEDYVGHKSGKSLLPPAEWRRLRDRVARRRKKLTRKEEIFEEEDVFKEVVKPVYAPQDVLTTHQLAALHGHLTGKAELSPAMRAAIGSRLQAAKKVVGEGEDQKVVPLMARSQVRHLSEALTAAEARMSHGGEHLSRQGQKSPGSPLTPPPSGTTLGQPSGQPQQSATGTGFTTLGSGLTEASKKYLTFAGPALSSAAPDVTETLAGSFKLLAAQVGTVLVPSAIKLSRVLQDLANRFGDLPKEAKERWGMVGGGLGALALGTIGARAVGLDKAAIGAFKFARAHPLGAAAAVVGAGLVAEQGLGFGEGSGPYRPTQMTLFGTPLGVNLPGSGFYAEHFNRLHAAQGERLRTAGALGKVRQVADIEKLPAVLSLPRGHDSVRLGKALTSAGWEAARSRAEYDHLLKVAQRPGHSPADDMRAARAKETMVTTELTHRELVTYEKYLKVKAMPDGAARAEAMTKLEASLPGNKLLQSERDKELLRVAPFLGAFAQANPGYYTPEDLHKKIQLDALQQNPLQDELRKINQRMLDELLKELSPAVKKIAQSVTGGASTGAGSAP